MSPVCKTADNWRLTVDQKVKVVLFYAETKSVVSTQRRFRAHFGTRWAPCKQTIYRLSWRTIFQPLSINSVPDVRCFCNNKNGLYVQSVVWRSMRYSVYYKMVSGPYNIRFFWFVFIVSHQVLWLLFYDICFCRNHVIDERTKLNTMEGLSAV